MTDRPGPQPHNIGITSGHQKTKPIPQRVYELENEAARLAEVCENMAGRLDELAAENRRLRAEKGEAAK